MKIKEFKMIVFLLLIFVLSINAKFLRDDINNVVLDTKTNLLWEDGTIVDTFLWIEAVDYCKDLNISNISSWRLPNINELSSIIDDKVSYPALKKEFLNKSSNIYWTSTTYESSSTNAWSIDFSSGGSAYSNKASSRYVRCVH